MIYRIIFVAVPVFGSVIKSSGLRRSVDYHKLRMIEVWRAY